MYFGADYYPEHWVFPYAGTADNPEGAWERDAALMAKAGINVVRIGEFSWGLCEPEEGKYDFLWLRRVMDIMGASRHQGRARHAHRRAAHLAREKTSGNPAARRAWPGQTRRHAPRRLLEQRCLLGLFQTHRHRDGRGARRPSAARSRGRLTTAWAETTRNFPSTKPRARNGISGFRPNTKRLSASTICWAFVSGDKP